MSYDNNRSPEENLKRVEAEREKKSRGKFRKKPIVIEAYQTQERITIPTLEGDMVAEPGDWIITGVKGEQYPCKPDIFEMTYEPVDEGK